MYRIEITPKESNSFSDFFKNLYTENSQRFMLGHEPVNQDLENCYVLYRNNLPVGRFALYNNPTLFYKGKKAASIGSYECEKKQASANFILHFAQKRAKKLGFEFLIGPMEGSTWNTYRFSTSNETPNFFMEPYHHIYYNQQFTNFGFSTIANYFSDLDTTLNYDAQFLNEYQQQLDRAGARLRNLNVDDLENELLKIGKFSIEAFNKNFLFTEITPEQFVEKYSKIKELIKPKFVWILENSAQEIEAFMFSVPDYFCKTEKRIIAKSIVRKYDSPFKGAGVFLGGIMNQAAKKADFTQGIHALVISYNPSKELSKKYAGKNFKNYKLYGLAL